MRKEPGKATEMRERKGAQAMGGKMGDKKGKVGKGGSLLGEV